MLAHSSPAHPPIQLPGPTHLEDFVKDGKLRLGLEDAILLTLENNTDINVDHLQFDLSRFALQRAYGTFDPSISLVLLPLAQCLPPHHHLQAPQRSAA